MTTTVSLRVHGHLRRLLPAPVSAAARFSHTISRRASIKDVIESLGIPHTEIGCLTVNGRKTDFEYILRDTDRIEVLPFEPPVEVRLPSLLRPRPFTEIRFAVDVNVAKLAPLLRLAGYDTAYENHWDDSDLAHIAADEERILLTRDTSLLKRKIVIHGHLVQETEPRRQLAEVVQFYNLSAGARPLSRCLRCNALLEPVAKEKIIDQLEPLTRKYYNAFHRCPGCGKIYWPGSHRDNMAPYLGIIGANQWEAQKK